MRPIHHRTLSLHPRGTAVRGVLGATLSRFLSLVVAILGCPTAVLSADQTADASANEKTSPAKSFSIPAGDATVTLKQFSEQSGLSIMFAPDRVAGVVTKRVVGEMFAQIALEKLLAGTALYAVPTKQPGAYAIRREAPDARDDKTAAQKTGGPAGNSKKKMRTKPDKPKNR